MGTNRRTRITLVLLSVLSLFLWLKLSYPQLEFIRFSISRNDALKIARDYLSQKRGEDVSRFQAAIVFSSDEDCNRYLQKTIGFQGLIRFIRRYDVDLFYWVVRFFRQNEKEEYRVFISSATGEIISFRHTIDDSAARESLERDEAKKRVVEFLKETFQFDVDQHTIQGDLRTILDNRSDFSLSWQRNDVQIPWSPEENTGTAKLLISAKISGNEILSFSKNTLLIPDQFNRYLSSKQDTGRILSTTIHIFYLTLFTAAVFFMIVRRSHLAMHTTKKFYMNLMALSFILSLFSAANYAQNILFNYDTTSSFSTYFWQFSVNTLLNALFVSIAIFMPSLAGEALHYQFFPDKIEGSFLYFIRTTFFSRRAAQAVFIGYCLWAVMLGIQSVIIAVGQKYWGVWIEHSWMNNLSSAYLPFLAAVTIGFKASLAEELMYRLFAISWGKKILKSTLAAIIVSSLIWGFSHSAYPVFPMWFRGVEVTCLGVFLSFAYLRFGLIPVIIAHYLFDVFWNCSEHLFGISQPFYFYSSLAVFLLPLGLGLAAWMINKEEIVRPMRWHLNKHQLYNLEVLKNFLAAHKDTLADKPSQTIKDEIVSHGWDIAVVEVALEDLGLTK